MTTIVTRAGKGSALTFNEMDANFVNLNSSLGTQSNASGVTYTSTKTGAAALTVALKLGIYQSVTDFTGVDPTGATDSTTGLQAAMNGSTYLYWPPGTYLTNSLTWPSTLHACFGDSEGTSIIQANGTITANAAIFSLSGVSDFVIRDLQMTIDPSPYPTILGIQMLTCTAGELVRLRFPKSGAAAIRGSACSDITVADCPLVANWTSNGITFPNNTGTNTRIKVINCYVPATGTQTSHNINIISGGGHTVEKCVVVGNIAGLFGVNFLSVTQGDIRGNLASAGLAEGFNAQDSANVKITGNTVVGAALHADFGISLFGTVGNGCTSCEVSDNVIIGAGKAGVAFAAYINNCKATGNLIINPNRLNQAQWGGVTFYGLGCNSNVAQGNYCYDANSQMKFAVNEFNDGTGNPNFNQFIDNPYSAAGLSFEIGGYPNGGPAQATLLGASSQGWMTQWQSYTPTVTATGGNPTTTVNAANYRSRGKTVEIQWDLTFTALNGATAGLTVSLPITATTNGGSLPGRETVTNGWVINAVANGTGGIVLNYNNVFPITTNSRIVQSGIYKAA